MRIPEAAEEVVHSALEAVDSVAPGMPLVAEAASELAARRLERQKSRAR